MVSWLKSKNNGSFISIYVQPGASSTSIEGEHDGRLKIKIKGKPQDGEANRELISFLAELLGVAKSKVFLLKGETSRQKLIFAEVPVSEVITRFKC